AFTTWLYRIVVNVSLDLARRSGRSATVPLESSEDDRLSPVDHLAAEETQDPSVSLLRAERARAVQATLLSLPPLYRAVLVLYELQGLAYDQIAAVLGIPIGTVKSRLNRARQAFARNFAQHLELFGLGEGQTRREDEDERRPT
ncbi:MAG: sigma-70 family RNA polymerase sigma factor, partial [Armatimonadetes bacterium]|nr:sigma-70 family RNA polymerase sigma factor [Armatimonadota bacterium]